MRVLSYRATSKNTSLEVVWKMLVGLEVAAEFQGEQSGDRLIDAGEIQLPPKYDLPVLQWKLRYIWNWKTWNFPLPSFSRIWGEILAAIPTNFLCIIYTLTTPAYSQGLPQAETLCKSRKAAFSNSFPWRYSTCLHNFNHLTLGMVYCSEFPMISAFLLLLPTNITSSTRWNFGDAMVGATFFARSSYTVRKKAQCQASIPPHPILSLWLLQHPMFK